MWVCFEASLAVLSPLSSTGAQADCQHLPWGMGPAAVPFAESSLPAADDPLCLIPGSHLNSTPAWGHLLLGPTNKWTTT